MSRGIIDAIRILSDTKTTDKVNILTASVVSVDISTRSCVVKAVSGQSEINISGVQLMASVDDGFLLVPSVDSIVLVVYSKFNKPFVLMFSSVDRFYLVVGDSIIDISSSEIKFNDGSLGGLVKISDLVTKLNNVENLVNDLVTKFNSHTHILALSAGTGTAAVTAAPETTVLTPTVRADIENTKIKHG